MENNKCPICGESISEFELSGFWECDKCPFMCALEDLPRIAAAMELARARQEYQRAKYADVELTHTELQARLGRVLVADQRVLEVFGGE